MDISALLGASTATAPSALSFGVMGGGSGNATPSGEGLEGLDSFNQLLGNFLSLTGDEAVASDGETMTGLSTEDVEGKLLSDSGSPVLPSGLGALLGRGLKGLNLSNLAGNGMPGNTGIAAKGVEARWAQSGISLLAGGGLSGQEMNPEVVAFLNDLSQAFTAANPLMDAEAATDGTIPADGEAPEGEIDILTALQGDTVGDSALVVQMMQLTVSSASSNAPVIPVLSTDTTPSALGVNLTISGTGLKALPTTPDASQTAAKGPVTTSVIPKLDASATPSPVAAANPATLAEMAAPATTGPTPKSAAIVGPQPEPAVAQTAQTTEADSPAPAAAPAAVNTASTSAPATVSPAATGDDDRQGAIALSADLAATVTGDDEADLKDVAAARATITTKADASTAPAATVTEQKAAPVTELKAAPAVSAPAAQATTGTAAATQDGTTQPEASVVNTNTNSASASAPGPSVTLTAAAAKPTPTVAKAETKPAEAAVLPSPELPVETEATAAAEPEQAVASTATSQTPHGQTVRASGTTPPTVATRSTGSSTNARAATDNGTKPVEGEDLTAAEAAAEDDEAVTNNRMLAPKHVGNEARAEMQADMTGPAQSAGQNQPSTRADTMAVRAETEDNLLSRAITAGAKGHETGSSTDGGSEGGSGFAEPTPADSVDPSSAGLHAGDNGKVQGNDFAQSLRQTSGPHRSNAYTPPGQQMAFHVQRAVQDGNDRVSIQLNPYELGRIDVQLEIGSEGKLRAKVMVENPATLEMLQKDAKNLEKALQEAGLQTDGNSLSFSLQDSGDQAQQRQDQQDQSGYGTGFASDDVEDEDPAIIAQAQIMEFGRVDVRV